MSALALQTVEDQAKQLAHHEQLLLAEHLLAHLQQSDPLNNVETAWLEEADARYQAYQRGDITAFRLKRCINSCGISAPYETH